MKRADPHRPAQLSRLLTEATQRRLRPKLEAGGMDVEDRLDALEQAYEDMSQALNDAHQAMRGHRNFENADAYWMSAIKAAMDGGHGFRHATTMRDTIEGLRREIEESEDPAFDQRADEDDYDG